MSSHAAIARLAREVKEDAVPAAAFVPVPIVDLDQGAVGNHPRYEITWKEISKKIIPLSVLGFLVNFIGLTQNLNRDYVPSALSIVPSVFCVLWAISNAFCISRTAFSFFYCHYLNQNNGQLPQPPFEQTPLLKNQLYLGGPCR